MRALNDGIQIFWVAVHGVLVAVVADGRPDLLLELRRDSVFRHVHVRDLGVGESVGELLPRLALHLVSFPEVQAPNLAGGPLEDPQETKDLFVSHSFVKILSSMRAVSDD